MQPNLFKWATSELSQDAFLCWILEWAGPQYSDHEMNKAACRFLKDVLKRYKVSFGLHDIDAIKVYKQDANIDVWAEIALKNGTKNALLIEDKTGTVQSETQLQKYRKTLISRGFDNPLLLYFKTIDASCYQDVEAEGYNVYTRSDFVSLIKEKASRPDNLIFSDFYEHLSSIENRVNSFKKLKVKDFIHVGKPDMLPWHGFLKALSLELASGKWAYVPNKSGGFMAFYDDVWADDKEGLYIQLDCNKAALQIRLDASGVHHDIRKKKRDSWVKKLMLHPCLERPSRLGVGKTMAVAQINGLWDQHSLLDCKSVAKTINSLKKIVREI